MFDWSTTNFEHPQTSGFGATNETSVLRTQMDSGRFRQRSRFTSGLRTAQVSWNLTDDEVALFQGVVQYKLTRGADWFTMNLPFGAGFKDYTVRFTGAISIAYDQVMYWNVKGVIETEDVSPLSSSETDDALGL